MLNSIIYNFGYLVIMCLCFSTVLLLLRWKGLSSTFKYFGYYVFWNLTIEISARSFFYFGIPNLPLLHLYTLGELLLLSLFYKELYKSRGIKWVYFVPYLTIVSLLIILNSIFLQPISGFNSYAKILVQIILICLPVLYFYKLSVSRNIELNSTLEKSLRLINSAIIVYYSGSLFIFMFSDYFMKYSSGINRWFWAFNAFLNFIFQLLVLFALWKALRNKKSSY